MTLDPATRKQLIEARARIKAQLIDDEGLTGGCAPGGGPPDLRGVYAELQDELRQIDEMLGIDTDKDQGERGDEDPDAAAAAVAASRSDEAPVTADNDAHTLASRVVVDDVANWSLGRTVLIAAVLTVGIAFAFAVAK